jgi:branched-subunit amino acid aminotransferase/4-amino-4-deoxychorismate lyase
MMIVSGDFAPWHGVFETLRVIGGVPLFVPEHRVELERAMDALGLKSDFDFVREAEKLPVQSGRWRWIVTPEETRTLFFEEPTPSQEPVALSVSSVRVGSQNWDTRFKTLSYLSHTQAAKTALTPEVILLNEHGHVASASRGNIFWRHKGLLHTPAHEAGCRMGVVRAFVLKQLMAETGHYRLNDLLEADEIFITNTIRGIVSVNNIEGRALSAFPSADELRSQYALNVAMQLSE